MFWKPVPELNCTGIEFWLQKNKEKHEKIRKRSLYLYSCTKSSNEDLYGNEVDYSVLFKNDKEL